MSFRNPPARSAAYDPGDHDEHQRLWVPHEDPAELWRQVIVLGPGVTDATAMCLSFETKDDGPDVAVEEEITLSGTHAHDPSHDADLDDICDMSDLHQAPLLWTLRRRWQGNRCVSSA